MMFHESSRWFLLLLLLVPLIWWRWLNCRHSSTLKFSSLSTLSQIGSTWAIRARYILPVLRTLAVILLIVALARPRKGNEQTRVFAEGIAIQMLVDRSGSMQAMDFRVEGKPVDRLTAVRNVVEDFVMGEGNLSGRPDDLIGLIVFGTYADSMCPLTLDHGFLTETLRKTEIAATNEEGQTAIGDAIALGIEKLQTLEKRRQLRQAEKIKNKIMILLTDGENTAGDIEPLKAAEMASTFNIKVYTIGAGTKGMAPVPAMDVFGRKIYRKIPVNIDEKTLKQIADMTGGEYYRATDTDSLRNIYIEIDKLEKTKTEEKRFLQYTELATHSVTFGSIRLPPLLVCVF
ncbi:MAG: VWA domain-containing protein, partial [Planctomycetota bacterium]